MCGVDVDGMDSSEYSCISYASQRKTDPTTMDASTRTHGTSCNTCGFSDALWDDSDSSCPGSPVSPCAPSIEWQGVGNSSFCSSVTGCSSPDDDVGEQDEDRWDGMQRVRFANRRKSEDDSAWGQATMPCLSEITPQTKPESLSRAMSTLRSVPALSAGSDTPRGETPRCTSPLAPVTPVRQTLTTPLATRSPQVPSLNLNKVSGNIERSTSASARRRGASNVDSSRAMSTLRSQSATSATWVDEVLTSLRSPDGPNIPDPGAGISPRLRDLWQPDGDCTSCNACHAAFSWCKRRHHCRMCGLIFCGDCSARKFTVPGEGDGAKRVCNTCHRKLAAAAVRELPIAIPNPVSARSRGSSATPRKW